MALSLKLLQQSMLAVSVFIMLFLSAHIQAADTIYRCKLGDGKYQFQQDPCSDDQVRGETPGHKAWRDMRKLVVEGEKILQLLGPDIESIKHCKSSMRKYQSKLNDVNSLLRKEKANEQPYLFKAYTYLQECAECRSSAVSSCQLANKYLDKAQADLMRVVGD